MSLFTQHIRLFLIAAMVLSPVQNLFAMQTGQQANAPMVVATTTVAAAVSDMAQSGMSAMLDEDCGKHGNSGNCQGSNQCGTCPLSLAIFQISPERAELNAQIQPALSDVSLNSTDLLPDYRPPRYS